MGRGARGQGRRIVTARELEGVLRQINLPVTLKVDGSRKEWVATIEWREHPTAHEKSRVEGSAKFESDGGAGFLGAMEAAVLNWRKR